MSRFGVEYLHIVAVILLDNRVERVRHASDSVLLVFFSSNLHEAGLAAGTHLCAVCPL